MEIKNSKNKKYIPNSSNNKIKQNKTKYKNIRTKTKSVTGILKSKANFIDPTHNCRCRRNNPGEWTLQGGI